MAQIKTMVNSLEYVDLNNTPSFQTATTFSMATADTTNFVIGRRVKLFDANTMYGTIISVSATQVQVRLDYHTAQSALTVSLTSIAMAVLQPTNNSLPDNVWHRKNVIINGSMDIWQRSVSFQPANNARTYLADRWSMPLSTGGALAVSRSERSANASNVPTLAQSGVFFNHSLLISCSAVDAAVAAGEFATLEYAIEGYDWRQIAHKPTNLSFWVNTRQSGVYAVSFANTGNDRSFVQNYTISAIATWTKVSIPVPEAPTAGTWDYSSGIGLRVRFALEAGTTYQGGAGNWTAANLLATSSQVNFLGSAGNTFAITGIQLEEGQFSTPLEITNYHSELQRCRRYYNKISVGNVPSIPGFALATDRGLVSYEFQVEMRAAPTITYPLATGFNLMPNGGGDNTVSALVSNTIGTTGLRIDVRAQNATLLGGGGTDLFMSTLPIELDAEL